MDKASREEALASSLPLVDYRQLRPCLDRVCALDQSIHPSVLQMPYDFMIHLEQGCARRGTKHSTASSSPSSVRLSAPRIQCLPVSPNGARC